MESQIPALINAISIFNTSNLQNGITNTSAYKRNWYFKYKQNECSWYDRSHGVMVSTLDFESSDPSSNLGGTSITFFFAKQAKQD
jgi:hypothetical protein